MFFAVHFEEQIMLHLNWSRHCETYLWNALLLWKINNLIYSVNTKCLLLVIYSNNIQPKRVSVLPSFWQCISVRKDWTCWLMMWSSRVHDWAFPPRTLWSGLTQNHRVPGRNFGDNSLWWSLVNILLTISNFATTCQLILISILVYCLLNICQLLIVMVIQQSI